MRLLVAVRFLIFLKTPIHVPFFFAVVTDTDSIVPRSSLKFVLTHDCRRLHFSFYLGIRTQRGLIALDALFFLNN